MSKPSYSDIFGKFPEADIGNLIDSCTVVKCALNIEDRTIDLNLEARTLFNKVRAYNPLPIANLTLNDEVTSFQIVKLTENELEASFTIE